MVALDYADASKLLDEFFIRAEDDYLKASPPAIDEIISQFCNVIFESKTQAYRETLLGCLVAKILFAGTNIRQPYVDQGEQAFSGRTLDEKVINPFLQSKQVPCSKGPYLSVFRRSIQFEESTRSGLRDKLSYDAFLRLLARIEQGVEEKDLPTILEYLLYRFVLLREGAKIELARLQRISLPQYEKLLSLLLATQSGGRIPVILVISMFETLNEFFYQGWVIESVGINVADAAAGAGGDITIKDKKKGNIILSVEVTERPVDPSRVQSTFRTKIAPMGIVDYLFLVNIDKVSASAISEAEKYFAQGHEVNFVDILRWILANLATMGSKGRTIFNKHLVKLMDAPTVPSVLKTAWNRGVLKLAGQ